MTSSLLSGTRLPGSAPGTCFAGPRSPRPPPLAPPAPPPVARPCSSASLLLWRGLTSRARASRLRLLTFPVRTGGELPSAGREISRFPRRERPHMPGSSITPGQTGARDIAPVRVAFRHENSVGTRDNSSFAAQWLAYAHPLPTLHPRPHGRRRTARGRCGSLLLHRSGLAPPTPCRSPGALSAICRPQDRKQRRRR
jgi:hypothetical protein